MNVCIVCIMLYSCMHACMYVCVFGRNNDFMTYILLKCCLISM